jgi:acyl-coenzyme A thioesterase 13
MSTTFEVIKDRFQMFSKAGWDAALVGVDLLSCEGGKARLRLPVDRAVQNLGGKLHGGAAATLVDVAGTMAIISADKQNRPGVTTDLNVSYFAPGEGAVIIDATVLKSGRTMAFVTVDIRRESDNVLVAQGRMTKHMG